jgi:hypothetical protein
MEGIRGKVAAWAIKVIKDKPAAMRNTARQPKRCPTVIPSGAAKMVAAETPLKMIDNARGTDSSGTRRIVKAADIVQNPPSAAPSNTRPMSSMGKLKAKAAIRFEINKRIVKPSISVRRSRFRMTAVTKRLEMSAKMAVAETVCPAAPSLILKSAAMGVSRLAGRNSAVTSENTPRAKEPTAAQAGTMVAALRSLV